MQAMKDRLEIRGSSLWWKVKPSNNVDIAKPAGRKSKRGYQQITLTVDQGERLWMAHRVTYFLHYGVWPTQILDHKDRDTLNNDPENLRLATASTNQQNTIAQVNNILGVKGVQKQNLRYIAHLTVNDITHRNYFPTLQEAIDYRKELEKTYHPWSPSVL